MTHRSSFSQAYGGRASPYAPRLGQTDRSFSDLFEYVDAGDTGSRRYEEAVQYEPDDEPDVLHVKYMGQAFTLKFPAYSISESDVSVQEVRRRIAEGLQQDVRKIRLVYKDRELRYDPHPIKKYGCKQNSEIAVVVSETLHDFGERETQHSSGDDSGSASNLKPPTEHKRPRGLSTVRHRSNEYTRPSDSSGFLHPNGYSYRENHDDRRRSTSPGKRKEYQSKTSERPADAPRPTASPVQRAPAADPNSPMGKVQALQSLFYDKWLPQCQQFLRSPPSDATQLDREYRKLSESVMKHIIEAADAIELQGDQDARVERKRVLSEAQDLLRKLDAVPKSK